MVDLSLHADISSVILLKYTSTGLVYPPAPGMCRLCLQHIFFFCSLPSSSFIARLFVAVASSRWVGQRDAQFTSIFRITLFRPYCSPLRQLVEAVVEAVLEQHYRLELRV